MPALSHRFELDHPPAEVFSWHARPGAFERLTPPWESISVRSRIGGLEAGARIALGIRRGPVELEWEAEHTDYERDRRFVDEQVKGPFAHWRHEHRFEPTSTGGTEVIDNVEWEAPLGSLGATISNGYVRRSLQRLLAFRARRLAGDLALHRRYGPGGGRSVAITGATGLVGSALAQFLEAGGYRVLRVSRTRREDPGWVHWNPSEGTLDAHALEGLFAVVHLAGEPLVGVRWTTAKKNEILGSREHGTRLVARALAELERPPEVFVSSSAVGFYGNRGDERLTEEAPSGKGFLAEVCRRWEAATKSAQAVGIRTVHARTGVVLSPSGGLLGAILLPFGLGLGGRLGSGRHYLSWIDLDDQTGLILHAMVTGELRGALNATGPYPVTNTAFTDVLGRVLRRPTILPVPGLALRALLGEMAQEMMLSGQRVVPKKAFDTGFDFQFTDLEDSLRHQLGEARS